MAIDEDVAAEIAKLRSELRTLRETIASMGLIANDAELDGQYGDPPVRFAPRGWKGESYKGSKYSQCSAEFLDFLAAAFSSMADREQAEGKMFNGKPSHIYSRANAAKARGWSLRIKAGGGRREEPAPPPALAGGSSLFGGTPIGGGGLGVASSPFGGGSPFGSSAGAHDTGTSDFGDEDDDGIPF